MAVIIEADEDSSGDLVFFDTDASLRKHRSRRNILGQLSIDKIIEQRAPIVREQPVVQQPPPHAFSKEARGSFHLSSVPIYYRQPSFKQTPLVSFKGDALFAKGQHSRRQRAALRENPFPEGHGASFIFEARKTRAPFKQQQQQQQQQLFATEAPYRPDFLHGQSAGLSFQKQASLSLDSFKFHEPYDKLTDYGRQKETRLSYEAPSIHAGFGKYLYIRGASCDFGTRGKSFSDSRESTTIRFPAKAR